MRAQRHRRWIILASLACLVIIQVANLFFPSFFERNQVRETGFSVATAFFFFSLAMTSFGFFYTAMNRLLPMGEAEPKDESIAEALRAIQKIYTECGINSIDAFLYANRAMDGIETSLNNHVHNPAMDVKK